MTAQIEPLDTALWFKRIERIARGQLGGIEQSLRHAAHLLQLTPLQFSNVVRLAIDEDQFEAFLTAGDFDTAARHLIAQPATLTIELDASSSTVQATIGFVIQDRAISGTGATVASAVLSAWTTCLLALQDGADQLNNPGQPGRRDQFEQDRRLS